MFDVWETSKKIDDLDNKVDELVGMDLDEVVNGLKTKAEQSEAYK